jgi:hypothetical protein
MSIYDYADYVYNHAKRATAIGDFCQGDYGKDRAPRSA